MQNLIWTYYPPGEVTRAVEHIDVLVKRGTSLDEAADDAACIYRQRTGDFRTPYVRAHLATQWRVRHRAIPRGGSSLPPGLPPDRPRYNARPKTSKYPTEVSFRASFHRLFYE